MKSQVTVADPDFTSAWGECAYAYGVGERHEFVMAITKIKRDKAAVFNFATHLYAIRDVYHVMTLKTKGEKLQKAVAPKQGYRNSGNPGRR